MGAGRPLSEDGLLSPEHQGQGIDLQDVCLVGEVFAGILHHNVLIFLAHVEQFRLIAIGILFLTITSYPQLNQLFLFLVYPSDQLIHGD